MRGFPDLPPIWAALVALVALSISGVVPLVVFSASKVLVSLLVCFGFLLIIWSAYFFWKKRTTIEPHHTPTSLIVEGPYRLSRNPIYLGMFLGVLGVAIWSGGLSGLIVAFIFPFIITRRFIMPEEAALRTQFGHGADHYFASTSRWIFGL